MFHPICNIARRLHSSIIKHVWVIDYSKENVADRTLINFSVLVGCIRCKKPVDSLTYFIHGKEKRSSRSTSRYILSDAHHFSIPILIFPILPPILGASSDLNTSSVSWKIKRKASINLYNKI